MEKRPIEYGIEVCDAMMKYWEKSKLDIYELDDLADVIATSEDPEFDDDLTGDDWV